MEKDRHTRGDLMVWFNVRTFVLRWLLILVLVGICAPTVGLALPTDSAEEALAAGAQMERQRSWRDAIDHYKESLQAWPVT